MSASMRTVPLAELPIRGALDHDVTATGIVFRRLPSWTRHQLVDPALALVVTMPAGVRLASLTDARSLELDVMLTVLQLDDALFPPAAFDLVVGDEVRASVQTTSGTRLVVETRTGALDLVAGEQATIRFDDLPGDASVPVEVWLPHACVVELRAVRIDEGATMRPAPAAPRRWVHYGSSISHCLEARRPTETWPAIAARRAGVDLVNLAVAGQCMLDPHVARTIRDLEADAISVKAGINVVNADSMRERTYVAALHGFLDTVRDGHPDTPVALVTPVICPVAESDPGPTPLGDDGVVHVVPRPPELALGALSLRRIREVMAAVVAARREAGDAHLHLVDGLALFGPDDVGDLPDGLHPNPAGYQRIGDRFFDLAFGPGGPLAPPPA
jgi:hypothetical protein